MSEEVKEENKEVVSPHKPEDLAAYMFQLFLPRFRGMVQVISKKKLINFIESFVTIPDVSDTQLDDNLKQQILETKETYFKEFMRCIQHDNLGNNARRRLIKMIVEFPIEGDYKLKNAFEEKCFEFANKLLQAKFTIFMNNMEKFEELQSSLNKQVKDVEKELLLLSNKLMYAKFMMILHTISQLEETNETETQGENQNG